MRLDVALVGFLVFSIVAPLGGGYLAAWLVDGAESRAMVALLAGGAEGQALAAALGAAAGLRLTLRFTAGSLLDAFVGAWPENQPLAIDPRWRLVNLGGRFATKDGDEIQDEGPLGLGGAVGWVGSAVGAALLGGMAVAAWPTADASLIARVGAGTATAVDWVSAGLPVIARVLVASVLGVLAGAVWSTFAGPAAQMAAIEADVEEGLDSLNTVDAPAPDAGRR